MTSWIPNRGAAGALLGFIGTLWLASLSGAEWHVADFGAAGDGVTDDTAALEKAAAALAAATQPAVLRFEAGRCYRAASGTGYLIRLEGRESVGIEGAGATLLLRGERRGVALSGCRDVTLRGLRLDYDPLPFAEAQVTGVDPLARCVEVQIADGFAVPPPGGPTKAGGEQAYFGMLWNPGIHGLVSTHYWLADLNRVDLPSRSMRALAAEEFRNWHAVRPGGTRMTVPVRGIAHRHGAGAVMVLDGNRDVLVEDVEIWSAPWFAWVVQRNEGSVTLRRVHVRPKPGTGRITSSWRDGLHVKGNRAKLLFEECVLDGMNDDAFNIATFLSRVDHAAGTQLEVRQNFPLGYVSWRAGDTLAAYSTRRRALLGHARVIAVEEKPAATPEHAPQVTLTLDRVTPDLGKGDQVWAVEAANPGTTLRRCTIRNSCRFQSPVTLEQCDVTGLVWFYGEHVEGPLPCGSVVRQCRLRLGRGNAEVAVSCNGRLNGLPAPEPAMEAAQQIPPLSDLRFEDNEIDGRFELRHVQKVQLLRNRFAEERGRVSIRDSRELCLDGNRLGGEALPAARIQTDGKEGDTITVR